jgi:tellurite resistance protein TehA-like permease
MTFTRKQWNIAANVLRFVGFGSFLTAMISLLLLCVYYAAKRPHMPQPEFSWTVLLHLGATGAPYYGAAQDEARLNELFYCAIAAFMLIAAGECILIYKLNIDRSSIGRIKLFPESKR